MRDEYLGVLCDLVVPSQPRFTIAGLNNITILKTNSIKEFKFCIPRNFLLVMAVFGASLTQSVVVTTRAAATITVKKCKLLRLHGVSIDILEEMHPLATLPHQLYVQNPRSSRKIAGNRDDELINEPSSYVPVSVLSMLECITILNCVAVPAINRRLQNWRYFDGIGRQVIVCCFN